MQTRYAILLLIFGILFRLENTAQTAVISGFSPIAAHPRAVLTIFGSNLNAGTGARHVFIGKVKAQVLYVSADTIQVRVPFGATVGPIMLSINGKTFFTRNHFVPTYPASTSNPSNLNFWPTEGNVNIPQLNAYYDSELQIADLDNDGNLDIITKLSYSPSLPINNIHAPFYERMRVFKNLSGSAGGLSNSNFSTPFDFVADSTITPWKFKYIYSFDIGDINSDGNLDLVARTDSGVCVFINKGLGIGVNMFNRVFIQHPLLHALGSRDALKLMDFDGNGKIDILVTTSNRLVMLSNNSTTTNLSVSNFSINIIRTFSYVNSGWRVFSEDLTSDGKPDILFYNSMTSSSNSDSMNFMENQFGIASSILDSQAFGLAIVVRDFKRPGISLLTDLNQDFNIDIATGFRDALSGVHYTYGLGFHSNVGNPNFIFAQSTSIIPELAGGASIIPVDITGDGKVDLVRPSFGRFVVYKNNNSNLAPLNANNFNNTLYSTPIFDYRNAGRVCDLDKDGRPDLVRVAENSIVYSTVGDRMLVSRNTYNIMHPTVQTSSATVSQMYANSIRINIHTPGDGTGRLIMLKAGTAPISGIPVNYTYYAATQNFGTSPALHDGSRVVFVGDTDVVNIGGLTPSTTYQIRIVEVNGWANATNFLLTGAYNFSTATLPVTWLSFEGEKQGNIIHLNWQTASEINASKFEVERTYNGINWEQIGKVKAVGNTNSISSYKYIDKHYGIEYPETEFVYYRLKQIDIDGTFSYSSIVQIKLQEPKLAPEHVNYSAYPVPFGTSFSITSNSSSPFSYQIFNTFGQLQLEGFSQNGSTDINSQALATGIYVIHIRNVNNQLSVLKVCKE